MTMTNQIKMKSKDLKLLNHDVIDSWKKMILWLGEKIKFHTSCSRGWKDCAKNVQEAKLPLSNIRKMDKSPMNFFIMIGNWTVSSKDDKTIFSED